MDSFKIDLLRHEFRAGLRPFGSVLISMIKDKLIGADYLIYEARKEKHTFAATKTKPQMEICSYSRWDRVPKTLKEAISKELYGQYWGKPKWMELGWRLWLGTVEGELAALSWMRYSGQCEDFFFPLTSDCALIWQTITVPRARGKGLAPFMYETLLHEIFQQGYHRVYASCRKFNVASQRNIERLGFTYIGRGVINKKTGRGIWYPVAKPFTQG